MSRRLPSLFVSHGAPTLPLERGPHRDFFESLPRSVEAPRAILMVSAHWQTDAPRVTVSATPETIHDFFGFPAPLYELRYDAPGDPALAEAIVRRLRQAGYDAVGDAERGLDHGAWVPLLLAWPAADVPVVQLSLTEGGDARRHLDLGRTLSDLPAEGVLIIGSGGAVHNLGQFAVDRQKPADWAIAFEDWLVEAVEGGAEESLLGFAQHPAAAKAHPTDEHLQPLFVAYGAAGSAVQGRTLHRGFAHGSLSMAAFAWH